MYLEFVVDVQHLRLVLYGLVTIPVPSRCMDAVVIGCLVGRSRLSSGGVAAYLKV